MFITRFTLDTYFFYLFTPYRKHLLHYKKNACRGLFLPSVLLYSWVPVPVFLSCQSSIPSNFLTDIRQNNGSCYVFSLLLRCCVLLPYFIYDFVKFYWIFLFSNSSLKMIKTLVQRPTTDGFYCSRHSSHNPNLMNIFCLLVSTISG